MVVVANHGAPKKAGQSGYRSDLMLFDFDVDKGSFELIRTTSYVDCHFDCAVAHEGLIFVTDQANDCVKAFDSEDLYQVGEIKGFSFPHGVDIGFGLMAVTNYGTNDIDIITLKKYYPSLKVFSKQRFRITYWLRRKLQRLSFKG